MNVAASTKFPAPSPLTVSTEIADTADGYTWTVSARGVDYSYVANGTCATAFGASFKVRRHSWVARRQHTRQHAAAPR